MNLFKRIREAVAKVFPSSRARREAEKQAQAEAQRRALEEANARMAKQIAEQQRHIEALEKAVEAAQKSSLPDITGSGAVEDAKKTAEEAKSARKIYNIKGVRKDGRVKIDTSVPDLSVTLKEPPEPKREIDIEDMGDYFFNDIMDGYDMFLGGLSKRVTNTLRNAKDLDAVKDLMEGEYYTTVVEVFVRYTKGLHAGDTLPANAVQTLLDNIEAFLSACERRGFIY